MIPFWLAAVLGIVWAALILYLFKKTPTWSRNRLVAWLRTPEFEEVLDPIMGRYHQDLVEGVQDLFSPKEDSQGREIPNDLVNSFVRSFLRAVGAQTGNLSHQLQAHQMDDLPEEEAQALQMGQAIDQLFAEYLGVKCPDGVKLSLMKKISNSSFMEKLGGGGPQTSTYEPGLKIGP